MGLFSGAKKKEQHRALLDEARRLLGLLESAEVRKRIPVEFLDPIARSADNMVAHVESANANELGDGRLMTELAEDVRCVAILTGDKIHPETRRGFRTMYFDAAVERLADLEQTARTSRAPMNMFVGSLQGAIESVETALRWFSELPSPQSRKYSADQARVIVTTSKKTLADLQQRLAPRKAASAPAAAVSAPARRPCPKCERANDADAKFCEACGAALASRPCAACSVVNSPQATFCKGCGKQLATTAP